MRIHWTSKKLEQLLEITGLNMSQLAHILKVTPRMVAYIVKGDAGISKAME